MPLRVINPYTHIEDGCRATVLSYPAHYRLNDGWGDVREAFRAGTGGFVAVATEGVHSLSVTADGTCVLEHCGHRLTFRLRGLVAAGADGNFLDAIQIDLSKTAVWKLDTSKLDLGIVAWDHGTGARYEVRYGANSVTDRLSLPDALKTQLRGKLPAGATRFGLVFDLSLPAAMATANVESEASIQLAAGTVRQRLQPSWIPDSRAAATDALSVGWREKWKIVGGRLVQHLDVAALDGAAELRTTVVYQQGASGYSGCQDNLLYSPTPNANGGAWATPIVGSISSTNCRSLMRWNISTVGGTITAATLSIYNIDSTNTNQNGTVEAHAVLPANTGWVVGTSSLATEVGASCWNKQTYNTVNWAGSAGCGTSGTDYAAGVLGSANWIDGQPGWLDLSLTASVVEGWRTGTNDGMILRAATEWAAGYIIFVAGAEYVTSSLHPKLTIVYTPAATSSRRRRLICSGAN